MTNGGPRGGRILILGAGQSSPFLVRWLLDRAERRGWHVTVADAIETAAAARVDGHPAGTAIRLDVTDPQERARRFDEADIVVNLLPPSLEVPVAWTAVEHGIPMVTASYLDPGVAALDDRARDAGVLLLAEMGLDPGIDLMSAVRLLDGIRERGGRPVIYESYGSGVPDPRAVDNPFSYAITWNPRNVVMAGQSGALYRMDGRLRTVPPSRLFRTTWTVEVPGLPPMEAYPNRDSLRYVDTFDLGGCETVIRGTLRFPGWCETWHQVVKLGLPNESLRIPALPELTWAELVATFLPGEPRAGVRIAAARFLDLDPDGAIMDRLAWLGLFDDHPIGGHAATPAQALTALLQDRLRLAPGARDLVILHHRIVYERPDGRRVEVLSTLREYGEPGEATAMARTVGLPMALAVERILNGDLSLTGAHIPTHPEIYGPVLDALETHGIRFQEREG